MNCDYHGAAQKPMDNNTPKMKMLQDVRELNYLPNRSALPKPTALYLMRIRPGLLPGDLPRPRLNIPIMVKDTQDDVSQPVKITHL
jgi:hypothetical protein